LLPCTVPANTDLNFDVMKISVYLLYCLRKLCTVNFICKFVVLENLIIVMNSDTFFCFDFALKNIYKNLTYGPFR
jgi:hypothetical protein